MGRLIGIGLAVCTATARAEGVINDVLADVSTHGSCGSFSGPPIAGALCGDVNGDGVRGALDDDFIEIVNTSAFETVGLYGWTISDDSQVRHNFSMGTTLAPKSSAS